MPLPVQMKTRRRLGLLFCVPLAFSLLFFFVHLESERTDTELLKGQSLSSSVNQLFTLARDAESGERGYLLTGDESFLQRVRQARAMLPTQIRLCRSFADARPERKSELEDVIRLVEKRFAEAQDVVRVPREQALASASAKLTESEGTMNQLRVTTGRLKSELDQEEQDFRARERMISRGTFLFFSIGTILMVIVLVRLYNEVLSFLDARDAAHSQLQALNLDLEQRIKERTQDLTRANEELQQFAYVASHDLQEPLRTITSFTQLLATRYKGKLDEDADEFIGYIVSSSRRMTDLINGLLALARLRKTGQPTVPVPFEKIVEEAQISLQAAIRDHGARIDHGELPSLVVDRVQFAQVIQNLISNAMKYRREEPPHIRIEAKRDSSNWIISVSDNGRGFDQQFADRIFGLFQRLDTRDVEGTGMGLSIARKIVERHGGRIWAESREGVGSTFYFSLPVSLEVTRGADATDTPKAVARI